MADIHRLQVVLQSKYDNKGLNKAKSEIKKDANLISKTLERAGNIKLTPKIQLETGKLKNFQAKMDAIKQQMSATPSTLPTKGYATLERELEKTIKLQEKATAQIDAINSKPIKTKVDFKQLDRLETKLKGLTRLESEQLAQLSAMEARGENQTINPKLTSLRGRYALEQARAMAQASKLNNVLNASESTGFVRKMQAVRKALDTVTKAFRRATRGTTDFSRGMRSTYGTGGMLSRMFRTLAISGRFMIASMVWRGVFNSITEGFKDIYTYGGRTANTLLSLKNALAGLRGSFAAAFAPILNFVAPALEKLIGLLTTAMNAIARFFAVLTGQPTYEKASFGTSGFEEAGGAAGDAKKKAEEYQKTLLGFDKINKLNEEPDKSKSGGGGGGTATAATWSEALAKSPFAEMVKKAWLDDADFTAIGKMVGEKLEQALNSIPWDEIKSKAYNLGRALATFFNGFNEESTWIAIGKTIAQGLNTAIAFAYGFVSNFDFIKFGKSLAAGLNAAIKTIDWGVLGETLYLGIKGIFNGLGVFLQNLDYLELAEKLRGVVAKAVQGALEGLPQLLGGLSNLMFGLIEIGVDIVLGICEGIAKAAANLASWVKEHVVDPIIKAVKKFFGIASPSKVMADIGVDVVKGLLQGISNTWQSIVQFFSDAINKLKTSLTTAWNTIKSGASTAWNAIKETITSVFTAAKDKIVSIATTISSKLTETWNKIKKATTDTFNTIKTNIKNAVTSAASAIVSPLTKMVNTFKSKMDSIKKAVQSAIDKLRELSQQQTKGLASDSGSSKKKTSSTKAYATGGFPEEGPFYMNRGEIAGKFKNGKGVVANNRQITTGIANAVGPAVYDAMVSALARGGSNGNVTVVLEGDAKQMFKAVQKEANQYMQATGQPAFNL